MLTIDRFLPQLPRPARALRRVLTLGLGLFLAGCSVETSGLEPPPDFGDSGDSGDPPQRDSSPPQPSRDSGDPEPGEDAAVPLDAGAPDADAAPPGCPLSGPHAIQVRANVTWEGKSYLNFLPVIMGGNGTLWMTVLVDFERQENVLTGSLRTCDAQVPGFTSSLGDRFLTYFEESVWDAPAMPTPPVRVQLECPDPGCAMQVEPVHVVLGVERDDPTAAWPASRDALQFVDHDEDGYAGITISAYGPSDPPGSYNYPPVELIGVARAQSLGLGIQVSIELSGQLDSCEEYSGTTASLSVDTHARSCVLAESEAACDEGQSEFVDGNLPKWVHESATFRGVRLPEGATCADARAAVDVF